MFAEERSQFVREVIGFKGNVEVHSKKLIATDEEFNSSTNYVLIGTKKNLCEESFFASLPAFIQEEKDLYTHIVHKTEVKSSQKFYLKKNHESFICVTILCISDESSRNNCPSRPDIVTSLLRSSNVGDSGTNGTSSEVSCAPKNCVVLCACIVPHLSEDSQTTPYLSLVCAVAKSFSRFSVKGKENAFLEKKSPARVLLGLINIGNSTSAEESTPNCAALNHAAYACQLCMILGDAPPNLLDTTTFSEIIQGLSGTHGFHVRQNIAGEDLIPAKLTGLYNVGKAGTEPPRFLVLEHQGGEESEKPVVFVGKGIIYDAGGLAIKPAANMVNMKCDMCGAAAAFCAFLAAALSKSSQRAYSVLSLAENAVGPLSYRNDDIIKLHCGLSVEVNNTDAEGRIVLADAISYATTYLDPSLVIDLATLTGAQSFATGVKHSGIYTNLDTTERDVFRAGRQSGDLCFPFLYCPEFLDDQFDSKVADLKNSVKDRATASSAAAGRFLEKALSKQYKGPFVHLDIAAPAFRSDRATGYGVALLLELCFKKDFSNLMRPAKMLKRS